MGKKTHRTPESREGNERSEKPQRKEGQGQRRGGENIPQIFPCSSLPRETLAWQAFPCNTLEQAPERNCSPWERPMLDEGKSLRSKEWQEGAVPHPLVKLLGKEVEELGIEE